MKAWMFRIIVALLALFALASKVDAAPCSILMKDSVPCDIQGNQVAPYSGVLMTESTAWDLTSRIYKVKELELELNFAKKLHDIDNKMNEKIIYNLKIELEDAPLPFYESPWFWLGAGAAFAGGLALGLNL